jgi:integrase/recombinase XerC
MQTPDTNYLEAFLDHLRYERRLSDHTISAYESDLRDLGEFLLAEYQLEIFTDPDHLNRLTWQTFSRYLFRLKLHARTIKRRKASINTWVKFLKQRHWITRDLRVSAAKRSRKPTALPRFIPEHEMALFWAELERLLPTDPFLAARDRCLLELMYGCGLRRSEVVGLTLRAFRFEAHTLRVVGKGKKEREIAYTDSVHRAVEAYRLAAVAQGIDLSASFFVTDSGKPVYPLFIHRLVRHYLGRIPNLSQRSPHVLRHTFATHLVNNGAPLLDVKEVLGHSSIGTTQVYLHISSARLRTALQQAHPRGRKAEDSSENSSEVQK